MKALTVCEPYASLIALPDDHPRKKRVENRTRPAPASVVGKTIAIHAGKSRKYLKLDAAGETDAYGAKVADMHFGAVVAVGTLAACVRLGRMTATFGEARLNGKRVSFSGAKIDKLLLPQWAAERFPWMAAHEHTEGPVCWVFDPILRLTEPVPCNGAQGLWDLPGDVLREVERQIGAVPA
jgi:hypothetical protein